MKHMASKEVDIAVQAAIALAEKTSATADALAQAKVQSDIAVAVMSTNIEFIKKDINEIKGTLIKNTETFVKVDEFKDHKVADEDHEKRIRNLELFKDTLLGKMWGIGVSAGSVMSLMGVLVNHFWK